MARWAGAVSGSVASVSSGSASLSMAGPAPGGIAQGGEGIGAQVGDRRVVAGPLRRHGEAGPDAQEGFLHQVLGILGGAG
jgi:hypothetical protein